MTYEVCRYVSVTPEQQQALARAIDAENEYFLEAVNSDEGFLNDRSTKALARRHDKNLAEILTLEQLQQYYRGIYNAAAVAEGNGIADRLQRDFNLTDQNWKFIRNAFYKMALEGRVINKIYADQPRKAQKAIAELRKQLLDDIEQRGGIRVNDEGTTVEYTREFDPIHLRLE